MMQFGHMTNATPPTTPVDTTATDPSTTSMRRITTDMAPPDAVPPQVPPRSIMTACRRSHHDMAFTCVVSHSVTASATTTVTTNDPLRHTLAHTQESYVLPVDVSYICIGSLTYLSVFIFQTKYALCCEAKIVPVLGYVHVGYWIPAPDRESDRY